MLFCRECGFPINGHKEGVAKFFCSAVCMAPAAHWAADRKGCAGKGYVDRRATEKQRRPAMPKKDKQNVTTT
jgi:hypothetical protein